MSKENIKILGREIQINTKVKTLIDSLVEKTMSLSDVIKKDDSISFNIANNYYNAKKYISLPSSSRDKLLLPEIEELLYSVSTPREYANNLVMVKKYLAFVVSKYNNATQSDDTWQSDFQKENNLSDDVMSAISNVTYESSVDEYNKPSLAEDVLSAINIGISEALLKVEKV